jgi:hypothetical protein
MRKAFILAALAATLVGLGGCGSPSSPPAVTPSPTTKPTLTFSEPNGGKCVTRNPPSANECVEQYDRKQGLTRAIAPSTAFHTTHAQCADWSQWQGYYPQTAGLHCVIIQAAYGLREEPSLREQVRDARNHGLPYGVYNFGEPGISGASEMAYTHRLEPNAPLGYWFDAEVSGVFWRSCEFTSEAQALRVRIFGVFSYPGGYAAGGGTRCAGYLWVSEWQVAGPSPFGGYPASAIRLFQYCGTCDRFGVTTDLDVDEGLIALANPPKPQPKPKPKPKSHRQLERELASDNALRVKLRALEAKHDCRNPPDHRPTPNTAAYRHACYGVWIPQGRQVDARIDGLDKALR